MSGVNITLLDGPMGSELERRGIELPAPEWSAYAVREHPDLVREIHNQYAQAGADVHTTATFRTTARALAGSTEGPDWRELTQRAVALCREGAGPLGRVAGGMAPLEDCYRPDLTPEDDVLFEEHSALAHCLADAGVDLLLIETIPTLRELAASVRAAVATDLPVWAAITLGPEGDYFAGDDVQRAAAVAAEEGAQAFLLNCTASRYVEPLLRKLSRWAERPPTLGAYANTIFEHETDSSEAYTQTVASWVEAGADIVGGCCGTTVEHMHALREAFRGS